MKMKNDDDIGEVMLMNFHKNFEGTCYILERKCTRNNTALQKLKRPKTTRLSSRVTVILVVRKCTKIIIVETKKTIKQKTEKMEE